MNEKKFFSAERRGEKSAIERYRQIGKKREEYEKERQKPINSQLLELKRGKRIPEVALSEISFIIESFREKYKNIIKTNSEIAEKYGANQKMMEEQNRILEKEFNNILREFGLYYIDAAELLYRDEKFDITNYNFFRKESYDSIDKIFDSDHKEAIEDIDTMAIIFFDLDGLKAVNDFSLTGHSAGDKLLEISSDILEHGKTKKWLESQSLKAVASHRSGDEFMLLISGQKPLTLPSEFEGVGGEKTLDISLADYALSQIQKEFEENKRFQEIINFSDPEQRKIFEEKGIIKKDEWPQKAVFKGGVSGGVAGFLEAIKNFDLSLEEIEKKNYHDILKSIFGKMVEISDNKMQENKQERKNKNIFLNKIYKASGR